MSTDTVDYIKDLLRTCNKGDLLVTYYRDCDRNNSPVNKLLKYIDEDSSTDYNWIKVNVDNFPDVCAVFGIYPPCTVWYKEGRHRHVYGAHRFGPDIITDMNFLKNWGY